MALTFKAKVINAGRITIPQDIRESYNIKEGDLVKFTGEITKYTLVEQKATVKKATTPAEGVD
jgi:AbrB family looped-hinge helix DNA binding protein